MGIPETAICKIRFTQQQLLDIALYWIAVHITVVAIIRGRDVVAGITNSHTRPAEVSQAIRVGTLKIAAKLYRVVTLDPGEMLRPIPGLVGRSRDGVTLHASDITAIAQVIHVNVRHAEITRAQRARVNS